MKKFIPFAVAAALALGACGGTGSNPEHTQGDANSAIMAAKHETKRAKAKGFEWRDTGKMIKKAEKAAKDGDFNSAVKLANKAKRQSAMAIAQAEAQKNAGPNF